MRDCHCSQVCTPNESLYRSPRRFDAFKRIPGYSTAPEIRHTVEDVQSCVSYVGHPDDTQNINVLPSCCFHSCDVHVVEMRSRREDVIELSLMCLNQDVSCHCTLLYVFQWIILDRAKGGFFLSCPTSHVFMKLLICTLWITARDAKYLWFSCEKLIQKSP